MCLVNLNIELFFNHLASYVKDSELKCSFLAPKSYIQDDYLTCQDYMAMNTTELVELPCTNDDLIYDTSVVTSSLLKDFGLSCHRWIETSILGATQMFGVLAGSTVVGYISDRFGRVKAIMVRIKTKTRLKILIVIVISLPDPSTK